MKLLFDLLDSRRATNIFLLIIAACLIVVIVGQSTSSFLTQAHAVEKRITTATGNEIIPVALYGQTSGAAGIPSR